MWIAIFSSVKVESVAKVKFLQQRWRICFVFRPSDPDDFSQFDLGSWAITGAWESIFRLHLGADLWGGPKCHIPINKALKGLFTTMIP